MITHDRLPANAEEWTEVLANTYGQEYCTHCLAALSPVISLSSALDVGHDVPQLRRILRGIRREYGPWAVIALCFRCGDVACWPITEDDRQQLVNELMRHAAS